MRIKPNGDGLLTILSISPLEEDHASLRAIVDRSKWSLLSAHRVSPALALLQQHEISVVACERDLQPDTWIDVLKEIQPMPNPPTLIVTSRTADDHLWAEALNLGAWDVLAKPFDRSEVTRSVKLAWDHWHRQKEALSKPVSAISTMKTFAARAS